MSKNLITSHLEQTLIMDDNNNNNNNNNNSDKREVHDFMNVESFSQLPFIRPAPIRPDKPVRLFGIEFGGGEDSNDNKITLCEDSSTTVNNNDDNNNNNSNNESGRRFECHYCCRNFPTSQALGGHQNAHKRERQHAKRAHLHSAMAHTSHFSDYSTLLNYHRLGTSSAATTSYPSWNAAARFYGGHSHYHPPPPINGSPLALWRIPTVQSPANPSFNRDRSSTSAFHHHPPPPHVGGGGTTSAYESKPAVQDNVSLDLHL